MPLAKKQEHGKTFANHAAGETKCKANQWHTDYLAGAAPLPQGSVTIKSPKTEN
jgi:hypothetical protein